MNNVHKVVEDYLTEETEYAIQIVGNWGSGKTYYYRKTLEGFIKNHDSFGNAERKYKPVYISLFGLKTIDDVATKIVLEFYQSSLFKGYFTGRGKRKKLNVTKGVFKIGLRGFLNFKRWGNVDDYLTNITEIGKDALNENEIVICFDDLERRDPSLRLEDIIGYVNSLVDIGIKVLIIANEDIIKRDSEKEYKDLKEKVIGVTIPFAQSQREIIESIINERYTKAGFKVYSDFLKENIQILLELATATKDNYRHLIYALKKYQACYSAFQNNVFSVDNEIKSVLESHIRTITKTSLAFAIEYKSSSITYSDAEKFSEDIISIFSMLDNSQGNSMTGDKEVVEAKVGFDSFSSRYKIKRQQYQFYPSLYFYLTNSTEFSYQHFEHEFIVRHKLNAGVVIKEYKALNELSYGTCLKLSDEDYIQYTKEIIQAAKEGVYQPAEYFTVMYYVERYGNPLELNLDSFFEELKGGLKLSISKTDDSRTSKFWQFQASVSGEMSDYSKALQAFGKEEIVKERKKRKSQREQNTVDFMINEPDSFIEKVNEETEFEHGVSDIAIFNLVSVPALANSLFSASKIGLELWRHFFRERYETKWVRKDEEKESMQSLILELNNKLEDEVNQGMSIIKRYLLKEIVFTLEGFFKEVKEQDET